MTTSKLYEFRAELECALALLEKNADKTPLKKPTSPPDNLRRFSRD